MIMEGEREVYTKSIKNIDLDGLIKGFTNKMPRTIMLQNDFRENVAMVNTFATKEELEKKLTLEE
jgi:hypothetical protein